MSNVTQYVLSYIRALWGRPVGQNKLAVFRPNVGVIAQDLQKVFPDAVTKGEDGYLRIRFEDMFYAVINAVKELDNKISEIVQNITNINSTIEKQNKTIEEQQKTINELLKRVEKLEKAG